VRAYLSGKKVEKKLKKWLPSSTASRLMDGLAKSFDLIVQGLYSEEPAWVEEQCHSFERQNKCDTASGGHCLWVFEDNICHDRRDRGCRALRAGSLAHGNPNCSIECTQW
jgi:hypothetical protein